MFFCFLAAFSVMLNVSHMSRVQSRGKESKEGIKRTEIRNKIFT